MTALLARLLFIILAVWLIHWFLSALSGNRRRPASKQKPSRTEGNMVKDPVCGMYMDPRLAIKHETGKEIIYFCSEECKDRFLKIPPEKSPGDMSPSA
jgi:uncharacterized protein